MVPVYKNDLDINLALIRKDGEGFTNELTKTTLGPLELVPSSCLEPGTQAKPGKMFPDPPFPKVAPARSPPPGGDRITLFS